MKKNTYLSDNSPNNVEEDDEILDIDAEMKESTCQEFEHDNEFISMSKFADDSFRNRSRRDFNDMLVIQNSNNFKKDGFKDNFNSNIPKKHIKADVKQNPKDNKFSSNKENNDNIGNDSYEDQYEYDSIDNIKKKVVEVEPETYNRPVITNKFFQNNIGPHTNNNPVYKYCNSQEFIETKLNQNKHVEKSKLRTLQYEESGINTVKTSQINKFLKSPDKHKQNSEDEEMIYRKITQQKQINNNANISTGNANKTPPKFNPDKYKISVDDQNNNASQFKKKENINTRNKDFNNIDSMRDKSPYKSNPAALENIINNNYKNEIKNRKMEREYEEDSEEAGELECETQKIFKYQTDNEKSLIDFFKDLKNLKAFEEFMENRNLLNLDEIEENMNHADKMIDKISELHEENQKLKDELEELKKNKNKSNFDDQEQADQSEEIQRVKKELENKENEFEELNNKYEKKNRENIENKAKVDSLSFDIEVLQNKITDLKAQIKQTPTVNNVSDTVDPSKEELIQSLKKEIKKKEETIQRTMDEVYSLKSQSENLKGEIASHKMDIGKKQDKISELQQKIFKLEQENIDIISKYNNEIMTIRESKNTLENYKSNYYEIKSKYELVNMRLTQAQEENHSLKKDIINLEKENTNKSEIIDRMRLDSRNSLVKEREVDEYMYNKNKEILSNYKKTEVNNTNLVRPRFSNESVVESNNSAISTSYKNYSNNNNNNSYMNNTSLNNNNSSILNSSVTEYKQTRNVETNTNKNKGKTNVSSILPSQSKFIKNESKILELETSLMGLQKKRDQVQSELSKMAEFPKQKAQILKKKELEQTINQFNLDINNIRQELREINALNRNY